MAADGRRPMPANTPVSRSQGGALGFNGSNQIRSGVERMGAGGGGLGRLVKEGPLVIRENGILDMKKLNLIEGKVKEVVQEVGFKTPRPLEGMKIFVNRFGVSTSISELNLELGQNNLSLVLDSTDVNIPSIEKEALEDSNGIKEAVPNQAIQNDTVKPWSKIPYIRINFDDGESCFTEDDAVKLKSVNEMANVNRLQFAVAAKVFGRELPFHIIATELRQQWVHLGQFHLTILGKGWVLCTFRSSEAMESILTRGPWYVNGHIIGLDKWSPNFSPSSMKGLSSPVWIKMPHLPLHCWDEENVTRIASKVGKPIMLNGNMFHWGRREFARVCVRLLLDTKLPLD
ncbi:hypothetical protein M5K25_008278 [Dendrobium thyrsiflorum]|uniref:DUF4283 domain-containing protein n=1 Tax=Dendrobium thyrsiflorum TaxID=117978 RepID=A0ABD0V8A2_DENTH